MPDCGLITLHSKKPKWYKTRGTTREQEFAQVYQHCWCIGIYNGIHVMNVWQTFVDEEGTKIDNGFRIFNTCRPGYHFSF
jgi:hypothetical protein